jgi:glycosyltransferase involved in cell wall biosynthesis
MKILFVVENYYPHIGGVEAVFKNLTEGLAKKGHKVVVVTHQLKGTKKFEIVKGIKIHRVSCFGSRYLFSFFSIPKAVKLAREADIIHTTTFNGALPAWIAAKLTGKKVVLTVHEVWINLWSKLADMSWLGKILHDFSERLIYLLRYDYYVAVSNSTKNQLIRIGIPEKKVSVVYNALDYWHFNPRKYSREKIRRKYKLDKSFVYMTYGRPGVSKGIEYVIKAAATIKEKIHGSKLMLILSKDPAYRKQYNKIIHLIQKLQLQKDILLLPPVPWEEVPEYIKAADCIVVPSLSEGFGYTAAEASAMNVPVVATNTTSLPEVVSGKYILVEPKNSGQIAAAVERVYKGKYKVTKKKVFSLKRNIGGYLQIYGDVVKKW